MRFLRLESLRDVRLRGQLWLLTKPFFCICAALDLSAALEMTLDLENHYPLVCHFDWRSRQTSEWRNLFFFPFLLFCHPENIYYPFRLSEWNGAHGEICVFYIGFVLVIWVMIIFTLILRLLEGHFKGVPIPPQKYPPNHPANFTPKRSLRGMHFLWLESLRDVRLRGQ